MENIFFALIAIGALCIDIALSRNIFSDINKQAEKVIIRIKRISCVQLDKKKEIIDRISSQKEKLINLAEEVHATRNVWLFFVTIIILAVSIIVNFVVSRIYDNATFQGQPSTTISNIYNVSGSIGNAIWIIILILYIYQITKILKIYFTLANIMRKNITDTVELEKAERINKGDLTGLFYSSK